MFWTPITQHKIGGFCMLRGKVTLEEDWTRKMYFEDLDEPVVSASNFDLAKIGIVPKIPVPHSFHLIVAALAS